jgi:cytochrome c oxidase cbb3-type subunit 3
MAGLGGISAIRQVLARPWAKPALAVVVVLLGGLILLKTADASLLRTPPDALPTHRVLTAYAQAKAAIPYESHCAACHGSNLKGLTAHHTPDLTDQTWLYDDGEVSDIERTVLWGIRSGHGKAHNVTDMPAFLFTGRLSRAEVADVAEYLLDLNDKPSDAQAAERGKAIFRVKGVCYDCHRADGHGEPDFGAPGVVYDKWIYGGDRAALITTISQGRHGLCPAWNDKLPAAVIRALAVKIYKASHD